MGSRKFNITKGASAHVTTWQGAQECSLQLFAAYLTSHPPRRNKDGQCFLPGKLAGKSRKMDQVQIIDMLVYDIDGEQTFDEVTDILDDTGLFACVYTSHNHMTTTTKKSAKAYQQWAAKVSAPTNPTLDSMLEFLKFNKITHLKNVVFNIKDNEAKHFIEEKGKFYFVIEHDPVEKCRVVLPLKESIVLDELSPISRLAIKQYKSIYHGVGSALGLKYDRSCADPSRIYYMPSRPSNAEVDQSRTVRCNDPGIDDDESLSVNLLDYAAYPRAPTVERGSRRQQDGTTKRVSDEEYSVIDKTGGNFNLKIWERNPENHSFDIEQLMMDSLPSDMIGNDRATDGGGFHIECPFSANHTEPGLTGGTYVVNGDDERPWTIYCSHTSCSQVYERRRLDYLAEMVRLGYVTAESLGIVTVQAERQQAAKALGISPETIPDSVFQDKYDVEVTDEDSDEVTSEELKVQEADKALGVVEVYEICLADIKKANRKSKINTAISRMLARGCEIVEEDMVEVLAASKVQGRYMKAVLSRWNLNAPAPVDIDEYIDSIRKKRHETMPVEGRIKELFESKVSAGDVEYHLEQLRDYYMMSRRDVKNAYDTYCSNAFREQFGAAAQAEFDKMTERYAKVQVGANMMYLDMERSRESMRFDFRTAKSMIMEYENRSVMHTVEYIDPQDRMHDDGKTAKIKTKDRPTKLFKAWSENVQNIKIFRGVTFVPKGPKVIDGEFNLWDSSVESPFTLKPRKGDCSRVLEHIKDVWCAGDEPTYNWVIMWLADILQNPEIKRHSAIALLGPPGTGKSLPLAYGIGPMLGPLYGSSARREDITGRFNAHLENKLLWVGEEALFSGDKRGMDLLKDQISCDTVNIERKGIDVITIPSYVRFIFTSNREHALHIEMNDRRFLVLKTPPNTRSKTDTIQHFTSMRKWLQEEGASYWMDYLLHFNPADVGLRWDDLFTPPSNSYKSDLADMSVDMAEGFFMELLRHGRITDVPDDVIMNERISWGLDESYVVEPTQLKQCFENYLRYCMGTQSRFDRNKYVSLFNTYIGKKPRDFRKDRNVSAGGALVRRKMLVLPPRRQILDRTLSLKLITEDTYETAIDNPESHRYDEDEL